MVSCEMHSALTSRIYKNGVQTSASGAVSPNSQWSIPMFRAEFLTFALKIVEHSRHLLPIKSIGQRTLNLFALAMRVDKRTQFSLHEEGFVFCEEGVEEYGNERTPEEN